MEDTIQRYKNRIQRNELTLQGERNFTKNIGRIDILEKTNSWYQQLIEKNQEKLDQINQVLPETHTKVDQAFKKFLEKE